MDLARKSSSLARSLDRVSAARLEFSLAKTPTWRHFHLLLDAWARASTILSSSTTFGETVILPVTERDILSAMQDAYHNATRVEHVDSDFRRQLWRWVHLPSFKQLDLNRQATIRHIFSSTHLSRWSKSKQNLLRHNLDEQERLQRQFNLNLQRDQQDLGVHAEKLGHLRRLPKSTLSAAKGAASALGWKGWFFTANDVTSAAFQHAKNIPSSIKRSMTMARHSVGALRTNDDWLSNHPILKKLTWLRRQEARLHGESTYGAYAWTSNIFSSPRKMSTYLRGLHNRTKTLTSPCVSLKQQSEYAALSCDPFKVFDIFFSFVSRSLDITFTHSTDEPSFRGIPRFLVKKHGVTLGHVILDVFNRPNKPSSGLAGFMTSFRSRHVFSNGRVSLPCAYVNLQTKTARWSHADVLNFFHEMGHALHQLSTAPFLPGQRWDDVEGDIIEFPSMLFENFAWHPDVTSQLFSKRWLPLLKKIKLKTQKQFFEHGLQVSWMDYRMHTSRNGSTDCPHSWLLSCDRVAPKMKDIPRNDLARWEHLMLMQGTYVGYLWSEEMACKFMPDSLIDPKSAIFFEKFGALLSQGGGSWLQPLATSLDS
jgi:Zn-dependent oligopeptidase